MTSAWQKYKEKLGDTRPWDLLNPDKPKASEEKSTERLRICEDCPEYLGMTKQCKQCGCIMTMKTRLEAAKCPLGKW